MEMHSSFWVTVVVTIATAYLSSRSQEVLSLFFLTISLFGLVASFWLAPGLIQLLLLVAGFIWSSHLCRAHGCDSPEKPLREQRSVGERL
ncbi:hypothetical protein OOK60_01195 [Trichothermofontia sichuanensis B231]|uniref:hypothetical protein n=1 Tax=Trichothermofontia sichuanensis TaxID=3045816 RepID=UPI002246716F|nr:hypothetical protein [Trichothermofontia sichuanensis]UZQ54727.1 hypothetical protein OOK60_01195 [Trichothermofontia sichuanensis B231]